MEISRIQLKKVIFLYVRWRCSQRIQCIVWSGLKINSEECLVRNLQVLNEYGKHTKQEPLQMWKQKYSKKDSLVGRKFQNPSSHASMMHWRNSINYSISTFNSYYMCIPWITGTKMEITSGHFQRDHLLTSHSIDQIIHINPS